MDFIIKDLCRRYSATVEQVKYELSPEYDIAQRGNHNTVEITLHGETYNIDEKLANLFKLINKYDMNTISTCQHNWFGWAGITFHIDGYIQFVNTIIKKARQKYHNDEDKVWELDICNRFLFNYEQERHRQSTSKTESLRIYPMFLAYDGDDFASFSIRVDLLQSEIPLLESQLSELFHD